MTFKYKTFVLANAPTPSNESMVLPIIEVKASADTSKRTLSSSHPEGQVAKRMREFGFSIVKSFRKYVQLSETSVMKINGCP